MTCVRSGASWIDGSRRSMPSLSPQRAATRPQGGYRPSPVSEPSTPRRCWRPSAARGVLLALAISAAWLGLVARQATTGGRPRLLGITKRGNKYLRTLLIHGARAALPSLATTEGSLGNWLRGLSARAHRNTVIVALASKLARI